MGDSHRRIRFIDMLPACACGPERVDAQILLIDFDRDPVVHLGIDEDGGKRGMPARSRVKGRNSYEAVDTDLGLGITKGVFSRSVQVTLFKPASSPGR